MSNSGPLVIEDDNLSHAWGRVFLHIMTHSGTEVTPLLLSLTGFEDGESREDMAIRNALDQVLEEKGKANIHTVANTIFPESLWRRARNDRHRLYQLYLRAFPRYQALDPRMNGRGLYFERLIRYEGAPYDGNQLEWIIDSYNSRQSVRRSMLQASTFRPEDDHVRNAQLVFPCLQHVSFAPTGEGLVVNAFYATQQLFDRAYGNYLGLCRLGRFMAHEMGLQFVRMNCFTGVEKMDSGTLRKTESAAQEIREIIEASLS